MQASVPNLAAFVRQHRKAARMSQIELADYAEVSRAVIQDIESGEMGMSWQNVLKVLNALNVKIHLESPLTEASDSHKS